MIEPLKSNLEDYSIIVNNQQWRGLVNKLREYQEGYKVNVTISGLKEYFYGSYADSKVTFGMEIGEEIPQKTRELIEELFSNKIKEINEKIKKLTLLLGEIEVTSKLNKEADDTRKEDRKGV